MPIRDLGGSDHHLKRWQTVDVHLLSGLRAMRSKLLANLRYHLLDGLVLAGVSADRPHHVFAQFPGGEAHPPIEYLHSPIMRVLDLVPSLLISERLPARDVDGV